MLRTMSKLVLLLILIFVLVLTLPLFARGAAPITSTPPLPGPIVIFDDGQFLPGTFNLTWGNSPQCLLSNDAWIIYSNESFVPGLDIQIPPTAGCGIFARNKAFDLSRYTEVEFRAKLMRTTPSSDLFDKTNLKLELRDDNGKKAAIYFSLLEEEGLFHFPLTNFPGIDLSKVRGAALFTALNLRHTIAGVNRWVSIQSYRFLSLPYFQVYGNDTTVTSPPLGDPTALNTPPGANILISFQFQGRNTTKRCNPNARGGPVTASSPRFRVLSLPAGIQGCGILNRPLNLSQVQWLQFELNSNVTSSVYLEDNKGKRSPSKEIPKTNARWQTIRIKFSEFLKGSGPRGTRKLDPNKVVFPFTISRPSACAKGGPGCALPILVDDVFLVYQNKSVVALSSKKKL